MNIPFLKRTSTKLLLIGSGLIFPSLVFAATTDYLLIKDLPFIGNTTNLSTYLQGIFKLGLGLAVTFTIVMLVMNGIRYMVSDVTGEKAKAKTGMQDAVIGLLIVFGSVLILNTINPRLTEFGLVDSIQRTVDAIKKGQAAQPRPPAGGGGNQGDPWASDSAERSRLTAAGIGINHENCTTIGQHDCTSVTGLSQEAIAALINLKHSCSQQYSGCSVVVTGGTEYWLHSTHNGGHTVDLRADADLNRYLGGAGSNCSGVREKDGHSYHWEDPSCSWHPNGNHWHVTF